jgi:hypothetical protein
MLVGDRWTGIVGSVEEKKVFGKKRVFGWEGEKKTNTPGIFLME